PESEDRIWDNALHGLISGARLCLCQGRRAPRGLPHPGHRSRQGQDSGDDDRARKPGGEGMPGVEASDAGKHGNGDRNSRDATQQAERVPSARCFPMSVCATELKTAFRAAGIAMETPAPAMISGATMVA